MSASKKRRKLPDEDLAAAVADIINSPITRSNLSFLRQPTSPSPEEISNQKSGIENHTTNRSELETQGIDPKPTGFGSIPLGLEGSSPVLSEQSLNIPKGADELQPVVGFRETRIGHDWHTTEPISGGPKPIGNKLRPGGIDGCFAPELLRNIPVPQRHSVDIAQWEPQASTRPLWQAEGLAALFEQSRVKRIWQAQDALSLVEEKVYDLLWGIKNQKKDEFRMVHYSLQRMANEARINIKTVRELIPRLVEKGFLRIEHEADVRRNIPTLYRVFSYSSVLNHQRQRNRFHVVKTGKGVFYVHPVSAALQLREDNNTINIKPMGYELKPVGFKPKGFDAPPVAPNPDPTSPNSIAPLGVRSAKPMGVSGHLSIDNLEDKHTRQTSSSSWGKIVNSIREWLGVEADDQLLRAMITACHKNSIETTGQPATEDELFYFTSNKASILSRTPNIRNHLAVLKKAVPECFLGETFRAYRLAREAQKQEQNQEEQDRSTGIGGLTQEEQVRYALWSAVSERHRTEQGYDMQAIIDDPNLDEMGREQAHGMLKRLGRYTRSGI